MNPIDDYRERLQKALSPTHLELIDDSAQHAGHAGAPRGGSSHFTLIIASDQFKGKSLVQCHRLVYEALGNVVGKEIHALSIQIVHA